MDWLQAQPTWGQLIGVVLIWITLKVGDALAREHNRRQYLKTGKGSYR